MLEVEFAEAAESIVPFVSDQLCRRMFLQSLAQMQEVGGASSRRETLPIKRLACILLYRNQADLVSLIQQGLLISAVSQWKRYINERGAFFEERRSILKCLN